MIYNKKSFRTLTGRCAGCLVALFAMASCDTITEDLPPCEHYVQFRYDRNMLYVDAFPTQVSRLHLYVYDAEDRFVTRLTEERDSFGEGYRMALPALPAGNYRLVAWAGLYERSYDFPATFAPGVSTLSDLRVKMLREADGTLGSRLDDLWHGELQFTVSAGKSHTETISLTKDTNRFRIIIQESGEYPLQKEDMDFRITDRNGHLNHDNSLLDDEPIDYRPYYLADADLPESTKATGDVTAVVAELNTLRLMENADARLVVKHSSGKTLIDIDLIRYLLLTKMEGHEMPAQEYLDRQDEYVMIFFLSKDALGNFMLMYVKVNGWTIRPQQGDF